MAKTTLTVSLTWSVPEGTEAGMRGSAEHDAVVRKAQAEMVQDYVSTIDFDRGVTDLVRDHHRSGAIEGSRTTVVVTGGNGKKAAKKKAKKATKKKAKKKATKKKAKKKAANRSISPPPKTPAEEGRARRTARKILNAWKRGAGAV